jgi:Family of unknown function (DUF6444)
VETEPSREWLLAALEERDAQLGQRDVLIATLTAANASLVERVAELERRLAQDSSTSSRPPSSDGPYTKRALRALVPRVLAGGARWRDGALRKQLPALLRPRASIT